MVLVIITKGRKVKTLRPFVGVYMILQACLDSL